MPVALTLREREIAILLSQGHTSKEIGQRLNISPRTVEVFIDKVRDKTGTRNRIHMVSFLLANDLIPQKPFKRNKDLQSGDLLD